jgi:hypothetical protein
MSYDLMVFEPDAPPKEPRSFMDWYRQFTEWSEGHDYDDPANTSERLRSWYNDMRHVFLPMNGPDAASDYAETTKIAGYACARNAIYADFRWPAAEAAHKISFELAKKHRLGFWDVSFSEEVWGPVADGGYGVWFKLEAND